MVQERSNVGFAMKTRVTVGEARAVQPNVGAGTREIRMSLTTRGTWKIDAQNGLQYPVNAVLTFKNPQANDEVSSRNRIVGIKVPSNP